MYYKNALIVLFFVFIVMSSFKERKIYIPDVGDGWRNKVDSAIELIHHTDPDKYDILMEYCDSIDYKLGDFSTTVVPSTIVINTKDLQLNSINNIASVLVHESRHLYYYRNNIQLSEDQEELNCYIYEYDFLCKLPTVENWLFNNNLKQVILYQNRLSKQK